MRTLNVGVKGDQNELPHVLTPHLDQRGWCGISWKLQCPYEGVRPCGVWVKCTEHTPPVPPSEPENWDDPSLSPAWKAYWDVYEDYRENVCPTEHHPGPECWYQHMLDVGDEEPEYFLAELPEGPITGPIPVAVATTGYDEDQEIHFYPFTTPQEGTDG